MELHGDKRRGRMDIDDVGNKEAFIHWNGPPTVKADRLGKESKYLPLPSSDPAPAQLS